MDKTLPLFDLGRGTVIRVVRIGSVLEKGQGATVPFEYAFVSRGRLSRYQVNKRMGRWFMNVLRAQIHRQAPHLYRRRVETDRRWQRKHFAASS